MDLLSRQPGDGRFVALQHRGVSAMPLNSKETVSAKDSTLKFGTHALRTTVSVPWADFPIPSLEKLMTRTVEACFDGILRYIWLCSGRLYNLGEIVIFYKTIAQRTDSDPAHILDYESESRYGTGPSVHDQFIGVRFMRIEVLPIAYAIRSDFCDKKTHHLCSFAFQGRESSNSQWVTLDEQRWINNLVPAKSHFLGFVDTDQYFREFRILQTGPSHSNFLSFNISALEIHGFIRERQF